MQLPHSVLDNILNGHIFNRAGDARAGLDDDYIIPLFNAEDEVALANPDMWTLEAYSNAGFDLQIYAGDNVSTKLEKKINSIIKLNGKPSAVFIGVSSVSAYWGDIVITLFKGFVLLKSIYKDYFEW